MSVRLLQLARWELVAEGGHRPRLTLTQLPSPHCPDCYGAGGWEEGNPNHEEPDQVPCWCSTDLHRYRLTLPRHLARLIRCGWCHARPCTCSTEPPF